MKIDLGGQSVSLVFIINDRVDSSTFYHCSKGGYGALVEATTSRCCEVALLALDVQVSANFWLYWNTHILCTVSCFKPIHRLRAIIVLWTHRQWMRMMLAAFLLRKSCLMMRLFGWWPDVRLSKGPYWFERISMTSYEKPDHCGGSRLLQYGAKYRQYDEGANLKFWTLTWTYCGTCFVDTRPGSYGRHGLLLAIWMVSYSKSNAFPRKRLQR